MDKVKAKALHRQLQQRFQRLSSFEIRLEQQLQPGYFSSDPFINCLQQGNVFLGESGDNRWFIDLHPGYTLLLQLLKQLHIDRQEPFCHHSDLGSREAFGELKEGVQSDYNRLALNPCPLLGEPVGGQRLVSRQTRRLAADLRNDVMIIGIKPLGHFTGSSFRITSCHGEIKIERDVSAVIAVARRHNPEHCRGIQHMIVECKIIDRDQLNACLPLGVQMLEQQPVHFSAEILLLYGTAPIRFKLLLPFAVSADSRIPETAGCNLVGHFLSLLFRIKCLIMVVISCVKIIKYASGAPRSAGARLLNLMPSY
ncbi:hypothetical protein D3C73_964090 [compost metagenome]